MRIVQALGSSRRGGAERFFTRLTAAFHRRGVAQTALLRRGSWAQAQLDDAGVASRSAPFAGKFDLLTRYRFRNVLQTSQADVVITWMRRAAAACPSGPWLHIGRLGNYYRLDAFAGCDHLIGNTPGIVDYIVNSGWSADRVHYVPNFVPEVKAAPLPRSDFDTPTDVPLIVWLGRLEQEKGPDLVVRALTRVPGAYLWMAGTGAYEPEVKALAASLGVAERIRFLGWRDDIHALLETADIFVCASRNEALGNIILEAWSHGLPIVSTRSPGPEHLIEHGETGVLVPNNDHEALASGLNEVIADNALAERLGLAGLRKFRETFSEDIVVKQYLDLCSRLIADRRRGSRDPDVAST